MTKVNKHILVIGGGALGAFYASRFHEADDVQVSIICRSNYEVVAKDGFKIISENLYGTYIWKPYRVFKSVQDSVSSGVVFDYVLVTTKNIPLVEKLEDLIAPIVAYHKSIDQLPLFILMQNGVEIEKPVITKYPFLPLASAILYLAASQNTPGVIDFKDTCIQSVKFGLYSGSHYKNREYFYKKDATSLANLVSMLSSGLNGVVPTNISPYDPCENNIHYQSQRYHKLLWNSSFGSVCTLTNSDTIEVLSNPNTRELLEELMNEVFCVAEKHLNTHGNIVFPPEGAMTVKEYLIRSERIGHYRPSIQVDFDHKRPMEVEILLGNVVKIAKEHGIEVNHLSTTLALMRMLQSKILNEVKCL